MRNLKFLFVFSFFLILGCSSSKKEEQENLSLQSYEMSESEDLASLVADYLPPDAIPAQHREFFAGLRRNELKALRSYATQMIVDDHLAAFPGKPLKIPFDEFSLNAVKEIPARDPLQLKPHYEKNISTILGDDPMYNLDKMNIFDLTENKRQQCFSGTLWHFILSNKILSNQEFKNARFVVIFEFGHVLPGIMQKGRSGWELFGIETTLLGDALIEYGSPNDWMPGIRIVDANYFLLTEVFKKKKLNLTKLANEMLKRTAVKYELEEKRIFWIPEQGVQDYALNASPFGFGSPTGPAKDQKRGVLKRRILRGFFSSLAQEVSSPEKFIRSAEPQEIMRTHFTPIKVLKADFLKPQSQFEIVSSKDAFTVHFNDEVDTQELSPESISQINYDPMYDMIIEVPDYNKNEPFGAVLIKNGALLKPIIQTGSQELLLRLPPITVYFYQQVADQKLFPTVRFKKGRLMNDCSSDTFRLNFILIDKELNKSEKPEDPEKLKLEHEKSYDVCECIV